MSEMFMPYEVIIDTTYGLFLKCWIKCEEDQKKLRQLKMEWRVNGAKSALFHSGGLGQPNGAKAAPSASPNGAQINSVVLADPPLGSIWSVPKGQKEKLELDLMETQKAISELAITIAGYDRLLAPYWYAKGDVEDRVRRTHGGRYGETLVFLPAGAPTRKAMFDELLAMAIEWGPAKHERAELQIRIKAHLREARKIETELKYIAKKGKKREQTKSGPETPRFL